MNASTSLLKFQIGPVQDFIAQARSTRDLWSGSYLLSWLVAAGVRAIPDFRDTLIFPNPARQPMLQERLPKDDPGLLIPNLPNIFIARVEGDADEVAKAVKDKIEGEWRRIYEAVWAQRAKIGLPTEAKERYDAQVKRHLSIAWQITPLAGTDYATAYAHNGWHLDAVRQLRDFRAWDSADGMMEKDSLSGKEEALVGGTDYQKRMAALAAEKKGSIEEAYANLFAKHADYLGAVAIIKRCWHLAYLNYAHQPRLPTRSGDFRIRSIPAIAARTSKHDDEEDPQEKTSGEKYIAAIAFDGDSIGRWVNGDFLADRSKLKEHHNDFSKALSHFALNEVRRIVEGTVEDQQAGIWKGQLIYAGGDDVVCLVPADVALGMTASLRKAFCDATTEIEGVDPKTQTKVKPDASAGIAIGHIHAPLQYLIREAQKAEKRAKAVVGRPAFSVTLMKRSGEISHWGSKWSGGGLALYQAIAEHMKAGDLSAKFPHRVCQLLTPYLIAPTKLMEQRRTMQDTITGSGQAKDLIAREFAHAAERQGSKDLARELDQPLREYLGGLLGACAEREKKSGKPSKPTATQEMLTAVIGLCTTVAFADRNRDPAPAGIDPQAAEIKNPKSEVSAAA